jgi:ankyrin repeat protein
MEYNARMNGTQIDLNAPRVARSWEELFPLLEYCRAGKLKEVGEWMAAGNPIDPPLNAKRTARRSPLQIAIEKGFYALAELLLEGGGDVAANKGILDFAVRHKEAGIAKLLLDRGASVESIWPQTIFDGGREMIEQFIERGFDPTADLNLYHALYDEPHPLLFLLKEYKEKFPDLQRQSDIALCHHCSEGNLRAVSLLLWAGGRADAKVPHPSYLNDTESLTTPLEEAVHAGRLDALKKLKPENHPEMLPKLMEAVFLKPSQPIVDYLLALGAPLNSKSNGGSKVLETSFIP